MSTLYFLLSSAFAQSPTDDPFARMEAEVQMAEDISQQTESHGIVYLLYTPIYWIALHPFLSLFIFVFLGVLIMGIRDFISTENPIKRNFPLMAFGRFVLSQLGPPLRQYLFANDKEERPIPRYIRNWIYSTATNNTSTVPFGTQLDLHQPGSVMMRHSAYPKLKYQAPERVLVGKSNPHCKTPYPTGMFNVSAMSFGSLGQNAVESMNIGAKAGGYYQNTGEGGVSPHHLRNGGDLVWQLGTAKFGARNSDGSFNPEMFKERSAHPHVKMIELKLSQGAKPGKGGILPADKITPEIAKIRNVEQGSDVLSPARHPEWDDAVGMLQFIEQLQKLSQKPVGIKFCLGSPDYLDELCQAILKTKISPDYIAVDGAEGGTGAAPLAHTNMLGYPMIDAVMITENKLIEYGIRQQIPICASGKIFTGGDLAIALAAGADWACSARGFMLSIGCIQALHCNSNFCPSGIATHNKWLQRGLVPSVQGKHSSNYQNAVIKEFSQVLASCGYTSPKDLGRKDIMKVIDFHKIVTMETLVPYPEE